jgi:hypothetical protein
MILFCKNLGQAIVPSSTDGLCADWSSVPTGKKLLVATGPSVIHLLKKRTRKGVSRLGDHISWGLKHRIIELHKPGVRTRCSHVQYLRSGEPSDDQSGLVEAVRAYENGGYIFDDIFPLKKQTKRMPETSNNPTLQVNHSYTKIQWMTKFCRSHQRNVRTATRQQFQSESRLKIAEKPSLDSSQRTLVANTGD